MRVFFKQTNKQTEEEITEINQLYNLNRYYGAHASWSTL